jgi:hypothetical protein
MPDSEGGGYGHRAKHMGGVKMADHHSVANVCPGGLSNQCQLEILFRRKAALSRYNQAGAIE